MRKLKCLFLLTGTLFFTIAGGLYGMEAYKQWKNVQMLIDMHQGIKKQMEYYERNTPPDPYADKIT